MFGGKVGSKVRVGKVFLVVVCHKFYYVRVAVFPVIPEPFRPVRIIAALTTEEGYVEALQTH